MSEEKEEVPILNPDEIARQAMQKRLAEQAGLPITSPTLGPNRRVDYLLPGEKPPKVTKGQRD